MIRYIFYFVALVFFSGCVTPKIHNSLLAEHKKIKEDLKLKQQNLISLSEQLEQNQSTIDRLKKRLSILQNDSIANGKSIELWSDKYNELSQTYDLLASKNSRYISEKAKETKQLLDQLDQAKTELFAKEDELNTISNSLDLQKEELKKLQEDLNERSKRVIELEAIINKKDSLVTALKQSISNALIGLEGEGLTIVQRNGKVYISLEEKLLFASGKYEINNSGVIALNKLAAVLSDQQDLEILIEGHTDSIPLSGKGLIKDNWDLSVMRATSVVKVLTKNPRLNPIKLTAAGRAEFVPIANNNTVQGRSSNRRIEMILSPNLDDLFELLKE